MAWRRYVTVGNIPLLLAIIYGVALEFTHGVSLKFESISNLTLQVRLKMVHRS